MFGGKRNMKEKLKRLLGASGTILVICIFCFFGLKSCVVSVWMYPDVTKRYEVVGEDGRTFSMTFLPSKRTIIHYTNPSNLESEAILTRMRGTFGTHYLGPLWRIEGPGVFIGLRWVEKGVEPLMMEIKVLEKFRVGPGESTFPKVGKTTNTEMAFANDSIKFQDMWLQEVPVVDAEIKELLSLFKENNTTEQKNAPDKK
jgi:hypothetical protein